MNIKIKSAGVTCLVGDDYDRVYTALRSQLSDDDAQLFTERIPGHAYLQWELPGEGWVSLSEGDPLFSQEVKQEVFRKKQNIIQRFGKNQEIAQKILSVPDDSFIYYKPDGNGKLLVKLTAWGYRYPERVGVGGATGKHKPKGETEHVRIQILYDGKPLPGKQLYLNGIKKQTDATGSFDIGDLPIGYKFELRVDDIKKIVTVQSGQGNISIDSTLYTIVKVKAILDGKPYNGATASLKYVGRDMELTTDETGTASVRLPIDLNNGMCLISIDNDYQKFVLSQPVTEFTFNIVSPKDEVKEEQAIDEPTENDEVNEKENEEVNERGSEEEVNERGNEEEEEVNEKDNKEEKTGDDAHIEDGFNAHPEEEIGEEHISNVDDFDKEQDNEDEFEEETPLNEEENQNDVDREPETEVKQHSSASLFGEVIAFLCLLLLLYITYVFCYGMFFG